MFNNLQYESQFTYLLPATHALLKSANLTIHERVSKITLHGSRGLAGGYRPESDVDLAFIVDTAGHLGKSDFQALLDEIWGTTVDNWRGPIDPDLALVFDVRNCGLGCFERSEFDQWSCNVGGKDCFGLYKKYDTLGSLVIDAGVEVKWMYPCLTIWKRA